MRFSCSLRDFWVKLWFGVCFVFASPQKTLYDDDTEKPYFMHNFCLTIVEKQRKAFK